jgi:hypothetical protein
LPQPESALGFRVPAEVIVLAVRWHLRYGLSNRDVEELLVERGVEDDHVTVYHWVQRFTPMLADAARFCRHSPGDRWLVRRPCDCRKLRPCSSGSVLVFVDDAAESVVAADVQVSDAVWIGDRGGDRAERCGLLQREMRA